MSRLKDSKLDRRPSNTSTVSGMPRLLQVKQSAVEATFRDVFAEQLNNVDLKRTHLLEDVDIELKLFDWKRFFNVPRRQLKTPQLEVLKSNLIACCLTHIQDSYRVHLNRLKGVEILQSIIERTRAENVSTELAVHMTWAILSCIHHFLLRLKSCPGLMQWVRRRQAKKCIQVYDRMLLFLLPSNFQLVLSATISFYEEANIWDVENMCAVVLRRLLMRANNHTTESVVELLTLIENSTLTNPMTSRQILQVLYDVEESVKWSLMDENILERYLDMYYRSATPENNPEYNYEPLEKGMDNCLRAMAQVLEEDLMMFMIKWLLEVAVLEEIHNETLLNFGSLVEFVSGQYNTRIRDRLLPEDVFPLTLKLIASEHLLYSLLGNRILHNLVDRNNNKLKFDTPKLFYKRSHYNIVLNRYNSADKEFFQQYREVLHSTFFNALLKHGTQKTHLENCYISIALLLVEVPCGYTAAASVCLAMALQEAALSDPKMDMPLSHRFHAIVVSVMSLLCYIHKADVFYDYVDTIIERRANLAPHLNPPIRNSYKYAQHHILWNMPELFFEDWETRYGLWKCFKTRRKEMVSLQV